MSDLLTSLRMALRAIGRAKLRAGLTVLGILIGVAAVVIVVALGTGVQERVSGQISSLGANLLFVFPSSNQSSGARVTARGALTEADGEAVLREAASVSAVAPYSDVRAQVVAEDRNVSTQVIGVTRAYWPIRAFTFAKGASFSASDESVKARVVVIGEAVRENLFGDADPIGRYVRIGRHPYRVVGLLDKKGQSPFGEDQDDRVLMPLSTFRARVLRSPPGRVQLLIFSATDARTVERASRQIEEILRQRHRIDPEDEPDFVVRTQAEFRRSQEQVLGALSALLTSIAAVSLLVGGIGIMNIMLVSVTERTREIGIRMAIGARQRSILSQFLVEAVTLSLLGGLMGLLLGRVAIGALAGSLGWAMHLPARAVLLAVGTSAAIGIVFGVFPAWRASRVDPIVALRQEG